MSGANDIVQSRRSWTRPNRQGLSRLNVVGDVPPDLANNIDEHGSLVTVDPADWIVCFVPGLRRQWWHRFVHHRHKHVFAMRPTGTGSWLLVEPWWTRMMVTILPPSDAVRFLRWGATGDILRVREAVPGKASQLRGWSNCAVLSAFLLGRSSWAWTPHGLYRQLLREKSTRREDVQQLLVDQFTKVVGHYASNALSVGADQLSLPLRELLIILGRNLLETMMTPSLLEVCYTAIILEVDCYPDAIRTYAQHGPKPAIAAVAKILAKAKQAGEIDLEDCEAGARQFLAMLHGNVHLEAVLQLGEIPTLSEIDLRARTAVKVFLDGAGAGRATPIVARWERREKEAVGKLLAEKQPSPDPVPPTQLGRTVALLCSAAADQITGTPISIVATGPHGSPVQERATLHKEGEVL